MRIHPKALNVIANVSLLLASGALGTTVWYKYFHDHTVSAPKGTFPFQPGGQAPLMKGVDYTSSERSLVVFLSTTCRYCEKSVPFYNRLQNTGLASNHRSNFATVFWESTDQVLAFKTRVNLLAEPTSGVEFRSFGVHSTPTTLLVDSKGVVKKVWIGASEANESAIIAALRPFAAD